MMGCYTQERYLRNVGRMVCADLFEEGWGVGREEEERCCLLRCIKVVCSPRRIFEYGVCAAVVFEEISFVFIPSPLCHAFLHGNVCIVKVVYIIFSICMAVLTGNNEMHKYTRTDKRSWRVIKRN